MKFIELTLLGKDSNYEARIMGKICVSLDSIICFEETHDIFPSESVNLRNGPATKMSLSCGKTFIVVENYDYIRSAIAHERTDIE